MLVAGAVVDICHPAQVVLVEQVVVVPAVIMDRTQVKMVFLVQ